MNSEEGTLKGRIEAILFVAGEAVSIKDLARALQTGEKEIRSAVSALRDEYDYEQRGFLLKRFGDNIQLATRPLYAGDVVRLLQPVQQQSLSQAIRGVKCDYSLQSLMNKGLIRENGRKDTIGRPILYCTTDDFLSHFGLEGLDGLPPMPEPPDENRSDQTELQI